MYSDFLDYKANLYSKSDKKKKVSLSDLSVCILEDNPANLALMCEYLDSLSIRNYIKFDSSLSCLNFLNSSQPKIHLFLLDISLPGMDGFKFLDSIKTIEKYKNSVFVAVTAMVLPGQVQKIKDSMFCDYIKKPVCFDVFLSVFNGVLAKLELHLK